MLAWIGLFWDSADGRYRPHEVAQTQHLPETLGSFNVRYLLERGWTRKAIKERLGAPDRVATVHRRYGKPSQMYAVERVLAVEAVDGHRYRNTVDGHKRFAKRRHDYFPSRVIDLPENSNL